MLGAHQEVLDLGGAIREGGQQQDAVGQRLGSRQLDGAIDPLHRFYGPLLMTLCER